MSAASVNLAKKLLHRLADIPTMSGAEFGQETK
jgi:hypothetical protein